jgi:molybdopterin molybdotransferase
MKTFDEALDYLLSKVTPAYETKTLGLNDVSGRVLAENITSPINVPPFPVATMDGYALHTYDLEAKLPLKISQRIPAGSSPEALASGTVARIFTGAPIPEGANAVVMQEETTVLEDSTVQFNEAVVAGQNIRATGASLTAGKEVLQAGTRLTPEAVGLIASMGIPEVKVYRPLKVVTFTTGDELLEPGSEPQPGKIFNSNRYMLKGLVSDLGMEVIDLGRVPDTREATVEALKKAASLGDLIMTTGGVSVGEEDHIKPAVESLGHLDLWKVRMKPGKPLAYGEVSGVPFIGLPGNPVSAFATFHLFAKPYLRKMQGEKNVIPKPVYLPSGFEWNKPGFRREFARARWENDGHRSQLVLFDNQDSGVLTSAVWAEGFAMIPEETTIQHGDPVAFYRF